jgi:hypothetical protein
MSLLLSRPLAFGKGWGDFDIQMTISQQHPVSSIGPAPKTGATVGNYGDPILWNTTFQYHFAICSKGPRPTFCNAVNVPA